jgi:hypothetical protein
MIVKQEDFQTAELAVLNLRYFSRLNENTNRDELYYEIVLFSQIMVYNKF